MPKEKKQEKQENDFLIVPELPQTPVRVIEGEEGKKYDLITTQEALKEILESVREIKKGTVG